MTLPSPWALIGGAAVGIALITGSAFLGYRYCANSEAAKQAAIEVQLAASDQHSALLQAQLDKALEVHKLTYVTLKTEILPNVNLVVKAPNQPAATRPAYYLTSFDVCLWNGGLQSTNTASGGNGSVACTSAPDAYGLTTISFGDVLGNALINFQQYADCRSVVHTWQQWYRDIPAKSK